MANSLRILIRPDPLDSIDYPLQKRSPFMLKFLAVTQAHLCAFSFTEPIRGLAMQCVRAYRKPPESLNREGKRALRASRVRLEGLNSYPELPRGFAEIELPLSLSRARKEPRK